MTRFSQSSLAALAALVLSYATLTAIVTVPSVANPTAQTLLVA